MESSDIESFMNGLGHDCCGCESLSEDSDSSECEYCAALSMLVRAKEQLKKFEAGLVGKP